MKNKIISLNYQLKSLSVFRNILDTDVISKLMDLIKNIECDDTEKCISLYSSFVNSLYNARANISAFTRDFVCNDENAYLMMTLKELDIPSSIEDACKNDLEVLQKVADLTASDLTSIFDYDGFLPGFETSKVDLLNVYQDMIANVATRGYGIFAAYGAFKPAGNGTLIPIKKQDPQTLDQLYGYEVEGGKVLKNTEARADGKQANNVLLYGDAGTGKSSTIKACANHLFNKGVRLIQFSKYELNQIPSIIDYLSDNPLKFIFFIDDLSFSQDDDDYCYLKGILEGGATSFSKNILIYATTNRRHLIAESMDARTGNDLHLNDTLQETMSLSARFGLTITFSKPAKELYLEIVGQLARQYGIEADEQLLKQAEAFAIRSNGRSPRTAKQFIQQVSINK